MALPVCTNTSSNDVEALLPTMNIFDPLALPLGLSPSLSLLPVIRLITFAAAASAAVNAIKKGAAAAAAPSVIDPGIDDVKAETKI